MNEVIKTIYERRATRKFLDKAVEKDTIEALLNAGRMAPSAMNKQPWKFYVLTNKEDISLFSHEIRGSALKILPKVGIKKIIKGVAEGITHLAHGIEFMREDDPVFHGAPLVIFITAPKDNEWAGLDVGMCSQNMMLTAQSLGLASCPVGFGKFVMETRSYPKLKVPKSEEVMLALIFGYGNEKPEVHERKKDNVIYI